MPGKFLRGMKCEFPNCGRDDAKEYHVTYDPPVTVNLCLTHHQQVSGFLDIAKILHAAWRKGETK